MSVFYDNKKIIPVDTISIEKAYLRTGSGKFRRQFWRVTINGLLVPQKGSPDYNGDFWTSAGYPPDTPIAITEDNRLAILRQKAGALENLFSVAGKFFEVQPYDGTASIKFIPRAISINFPDSNWLNYVRYNISLETDYIDFGTIVVTNSELDITDAQESWQIEPGDEKIRTFKISHTVSAQANDRYNGGGTGVIDEYGWEIAKTRASALLGYDSSVAANYINGDLSGLGHFNHALQESIDEAEGKYSATETWLLFGSSSIEDYTITSRRSLADGLITVSIEGSVTGYSTTEDFGDRFTNASAGWGVVQPLLYSRATTISAVTLNATVFNYSIGASPTNGVITYNYEYNNRFNNQITGSLTENINVADSLPADIFAIQRVVARPAGPIIQDILTNSESRRTLTITVGMPPATQAGLATVPSSSEINALVAIYTPVATEQGPYVERNEVSFDYYTGRYVRNVSWVYV